MAFINFRHGGNIYEIKRKYKKEIIDFSANINPLGLPYKIKRILYKNFDKILHYPDPNANGLIQKIAKYLGINKENILLGNGSTELIYLITHTFRPKNTFIVIPTFSEYERAVKCVSSKIRFLRLKEEDHFRLNLSSFEQNLKKNTKIDLFFLCYPNNPTGNFIIDKPESITQLIDGLVIADEAFMDFLSEQKNYTLVKKAAKSKKIIVLRTFTKMFALPGLRIGYLVSHQDTIKKLRRYQPPWNVNSLAQLAAELILDKEYIKKSLHLIEKEKEFLSQEIKRFKIFNLYPSLTNFFLIKIKDTKLTSSFLRKRLIQKGILIRDCANFRGLSNKFIRIAVRKHPENLRLIRALKEVV